ncbi:MAG: hypothetical protein JO307_11910 [Bryobacterales bacterium]|nr:hypothetical protein [Bryobacterales bacterium]MBV9400010.1 hypothetical protein [Bryobacterales bacterium]
MWKFLSPSLIAICATVLIAADPAWKTKPPAQWTPDDAKQVLRGSAWSKVIKAGVTRRQSEDERREGGNMGQPKGVGNENIDPKGSGPKISPNIFTAAGNQRSARSFPGSMNLMLRWESALPIRMAELKNQEVEPPTIETEGYQIAIYGIPNGAFKGDPKHLGDPLKKEAMIRREGRPDVRPSSAEVFLLPQGPVVVYVFPLSAEITKKDGKINFYAQIGRVVVDETFDLAEMEFQGKLEL